MKKTIQEINATIKELKEFSEMQEALKAEIEALQDEVKNYMIESGTDEVITNEGKVTWREVISQRFDSTSFKKDFMDIYNGYLKPTTTKRFTLK